MTACGISDFAKRLKTLGLREYIYDSDNNPGQESRSLRLCLRFSSASFSPSSGRIVFRDGRQSLTLNCVKEVRLYENFNTVGTVFDVVCREPGEQERHWRFLAD